MAARSTTAFDAKWGHFVIDADFFTRLVYEGDLRPRGRWLPPTKGFCDMAAIETVTIDIPMKLTETKMVFSIGALQFEGDFASVDVPHAAHRG
jgi:hypothetical protein